MLTKQSPTPNELLSDLLSYIEQVEKLKKKPAFTVPTDFFSAYEAELKDLPGLSFNVLEGDDDLWMKIERLPEIAPPNPNEELSEWLELTNSPDRTPELKRSITRKDDEGNPKFITLEETPGICEQYNRYLQDEWQPWAEAERPRRRTGALYNKLFSLQQTVATDGAETPLELVWGIGLASWMKPEFSTAIRYPVITQLCDLTLNEKSFALEIRPRQVDPRIELDCYAALENPGVHPLDAFWRNWLESTAQRPLPFDNTSFDGVLAAAVGHLDAAGMYSKPETRVVPAPTDKLCVTDTWVLFARRRSEHIFLQDIERLKKTLDETETVPNALSSFVTPGSSEVTQVTPPTFRGLSSSATGSDVKELYFPLPYNAEQVAIAELLETSDGVVVQGPPGTGKTHTIANIICHYLAQGKRVLVTSNGESALSVVQEKLPESIRALCVTLLTAEREGMKQFEHSLQEIASRISSLQPSRVAMDVEALQANLDLLHQQLAAIDHKMAALAKHHMSKRQYRGQEMNPLELARHVMDNEEEFGWLTDKLESATLDTLSVTDADIAAVRDARRGLKDDLTYLNASLPASASLPMGSVLGSLHSDLLQARSIDQQVNAGKTLRLVSSTTQVFELAEQLLPWLQRLEELSKKYAQNAQPWVSTLTRAWANQESQTLVERLEALLTEIDALEAQRKELRASAIVLPQGAELSEDYLEAVERLTQGKSAFGFGLPFGKKQAREFISSTLVAGVNPGNDSAAWKSVHAMCKHLQALRPLAAKWNALASEFDLPETTPNEQGLRELNEVRKSIEELKELSKLDKECVSRIEAVFGTSVASQYPDEVTLESLIDSLSQHLDKGRLAYASNRISELQKALDKHSGPLTEQLQALLTDTIGNVSYEAAQVALEWDRIREELIRIEGLKPHFDEVERVTTLIAQNGATQWAQALRSESVTGDLDRLAPSNWFEAWHWRCAKTFLESIDAHHKLKELQAQRHNVESTLSRTYQDLIAQKTWLEVHKNSPNSIRQALQQFLNAIQAIGAGTGVRASRHRRTARDAMTRAYQAVPCWVMPQWRVSESMPPEVGLFDLVVMDEASQSDIWALPTLLRGKKLLIVGDHKQVSPSAVGMPEQKIVELQQRFLRKQIHGSEMTPDKSIYDLARVVFASSSVMLKEHFRCVPAIIEFSNREFYRNGIKPLRVPKRSERLDPPLIDVHVLGGYRKGDTNPPEAEAIVQELEAIIANPEYDGRTLGVVTLQGNSQAQFIQKLVNKRIPFETIVERKIAVGSPTVFQGGERDIILLSLVAAPGDRATSSRMEFEQRYNVAASRARDRMILFRSVQNSGNPQDLKSRLISHFEQPFKQDEKKVASLRELCESDFEREVYDELTKRGYRVTPQLRVGGYRIDFVVEGTMDRRLAVECDGDRFHGPAQWMDDMARQRTLERAGWTFWRCFASTFVLRREEVLQDLFHTLTRMGIEPIGSEEVDTTMWVEHRVLDPLHPEGATTSDVLLKESELADLAAD